MNVISLVNYANHSYSVINYTEFYLILAKMTLKE